MSTDRRELKREYKETPRPIGVFRIRNRIEGRSLLGTSVNLPAILNRHRFQLELGSHPNRVLQEDWSRLGPDAFDFEELDRLEPSAESRRDDQAELVQLRELWQEKLKSEGDGSYG